MKYFLTALCAISVAAAPTAASANVEGEAESAEPIVIEYTPEQLLLSAPDDPAESFATTNLRYKRREANARIKGPRAGLISMAALTVVGGVMIGAGLAAAARRPLEPAPSLSTLVTFHPGELAAMAGGFLAVAGGVGMVVAGPILGARKRQLRRSQREDYATLRAGPLHLTGIKRTP